MASHSSNVGPASLARGPGSTEPSAAAWLSGSAAVTSSTRTWSHGVTNLRVFGSVAHGEDRPDSDVDLLADLPAGMSLFALGRVQADLETILGAQVDLVPAQDLKPGVLPRAERELVAL